MANTQRENTMKKILDYIAIGFAGLVVGALGLFVVFTLGAGLWQALVVHDKEAMIVMGVLVFIALLVWSTRRIAKMEERKENKEMKWVFTVDD